MLRNHLVSNGKNNTKWIEWNEIDPSGDSALMMAYRLERYDALRILCDHGVNPKFKPYPGVASAFEMALSESNKEALKLFIQANQKMKQMHLDENREELLTLMESLPDFQIKMSFECESSLIPFVRAFTPHDTFTMSKLGSSIRLDLTNPKVLQSKFTKQPESKHP